jgi:hypothetical protein
MTRPSDAACHARTRSTVPVVTARTIPCRSSIAKDSRISASSLAAGFRTEEGGQLISFWLKASPSRGSTGGNSSAPALLHAGTPPP